MRKKIEPGIRARVALEAIRGEKTATQIASEYQVHPNQVSKWKQELIGRAAELFNGAKSGQNTEHQETVDKLHRAIGEITVERDWLKKIESFGLKERHALIEKTDHQYSLRRQCRLSGINRSGMYYKPVSISDRDRGLMNLLDELYTDHPFWSVRNMTTQVKDHGHKDVGRDHIRTLLRTLGLMAVYPKREFNLSRPNKAHAIYPYLLRDVEILRPNQVCSADITYIRLAYGFAYLVAVMDWYSRAVLSWRLSNTLDSGFCVEALNEAMARYGRPEVFNSGQGCQFTSQEFIKVLVDAKISISLDGRGRCLDNIFVERLWRSVKYENVYLKGYQTIPEARAGLAEYFEFYNHRRYHQGLDNKTPWRVYTENWGVSEYGSNVLIGLVGVPVKIFLDVKHEKSEFALTAH